MKNTIIILVIAMFILSCSDKIDLNGRLVTIEPTVDNYFTSVAVQDGMELTFEQITKDSGEYIKYQIDESLVSHFKYKFKQRVLFFHFDKDAVLPENHTVKVFVGSKNVNNITASDFSTIKFTDTVFADNLTVNILNSSVLNDLVFIGNNLKIHADQKSNATIRGKASSFTANLNAGSVLNSFNNLNDSVTINTFGNSKADISVEKVLNTRAAQNSVVTYKGGLNLKLDIIEISTGSELLKQE